jgi:hypothetical protein
MSGLVFEPLQPERTDEAAAEVTIGVASRTGRWRTALVAAVAVAVVAAVALVGRNGGGAASAPTTTVAPTTAPPTTASHGPRRAGPAYSEDRAFLNFLGARSGARLYGISNDGAVVRVDLDGGVVTQRRLRRNGPGDVPAMVFGRTGGAVVVTQDQAISVGDGPDGVTTFLADKDTAVFPALAGDEVWLVHTAGPAGRIAERRAVGDGAVRATIPDLMAGDVLGDDGTGALLVQNGSGVYRVDGSGDRPQRVSADPVLAWSATALVVQQCDDHFQCQWDEVDRATGARRPLGAAPWGGSVYGPVLSPDGTHLAYVGGVGGPSTPSVEVMQLATGQRVALDHQAATVAVPGQATGLVWSADGHWLFWIVPTGGLRAWQVTEDQPITVTGSGHIPALQAIGLAW